LLAALDDSVAAGLDLTRRAAAVARQHVPIVALFAALRVHMAVAAHVRVERAVVPAGVAVVGIAVVALLPGLHNAIAARPAGTLRRAVLSGRAGAQVAIADLSSVELAVAAGGRGRRAPARCERGVLCGDRRWIDRARHHRLYGEVLEIVATL